MSDINEVVLIGRLVRDSELRYTSNGTPLCNFSIAVNRSVKKNDQWSDQASFFDLTLWNKKAENLSKYLVKGQQIAVQGYLTQERWVKDDQNFSKIKVNVNSVQLIGSKTQGSSSSQPQSGGNTPSPEDDFDPRAYEDDIPF